ncbi:hypothetical protein [Bradyrhizobium jicamae]|uniref:hypothetical protein n=1 Tax=Bradyrhizobium jicamae TaxID=280332 RepID=UPI001BA99D35|nr:hypothetical protein [Bradyrhizobium jicamae]
MLGTDQPRFAVAATVVCIVLGNILVFNIITISDRATPPLWQALAAGLALSLFLMPFFFISVERILVVMSPWEGLATMTAAFLAPVIMQRLAAEGITNPFLMSAPIGLILVTFLVTRWIVKGRADDAGK